MSNTGWPREQRWRRFAWFALLYCGSLVAFTILVYGLRAIIPH